MAVIQEKNKKKWTKDGRSWYFDTYYLDMYGNKKEKKSKYYRLRKEAEAAERKFLEKIDTTDIEENDPTFESVYTEWFEFKRKSLKSTSAYRLKSSLNKNILLFFKKYKLHSVKINIINNWLNYLSNVGKLEYQNKIIGYLKEMLNYAKIYYNFDEKIINKIQPYKIEISYQKQKNSEWNFLTYEEFEKFISKVDDELYYLIFYFLYFTGVRIGEMIALNWNDIDFKRKTLTINKTFTNKVENKIFDIIDPKTKNSIRTIDLDNDLLDLLKKHYDNERKIYHFNKDMFVFGNVKYISPTTLTRKLESYVKKADIKKITLHGFRHSHASLLIDLGCNSRKVADRLGDTVQMIEHTYYHMFPHQKSAIVDSLNDFKNVKKTR